MGRKLFFFLLSQLSALKAAPVVGNCFNEKATTLRQTSLCGHMKQQVGKGRESLRILEKREGKGMDDPVLSPRHNPELSTCGADPKHNERLRELNYDIHYCPSPRLISK
jgi:hypothetical protein